MLFKKIKELEERNERQSKEIAILTNHETAYKQKIEMLEKENKKLIEDFIKAYHIVITQKDISTHGIKVYQDGNEIKMVHSLQFDVDINNIPNLTLEVH